MKKSGMASVGIAGALRRASCAPPTSSRSINCPRRATCWNAWASRSRLQSPEVFEGADLIVLSPDVPADLPPLEAARAARRPRHRRSGTGRAVPQGPHHRHHRLERQDHHHQPDRPHPARSRRAGAGGRQYRNAGDGDVDTSRDDGWNVLELSSFQLETIGEFRAHIALALNVTQNHLDRHHTFETTPPPKAVSSKPSSPAISRC